MEEWKPVVGAEEFYEVSNLGRVRRSIHASPAGGTRPGRMKKLGKDDAGYLHVLLGLGSIESIVCRKVHRMVAEAFIPNPAGKPEVNHKNATKADNRAENLEWVTPIENMRHAVRNGLFPDRRGGKNQNAILTEADVIEILNTPRTFGSGTQLARRYGVSHHAIHKIRSRKNWKHVA